MLSGWRSIIRALTRRCDSRRRSRVISWAFLSDNNKRTNVYEKGDESVKYQLKTKKADTIAVDNKIKIDDVKLWDTDNPNLYVLVTNLIKNEVIVDTKEITFGFRDIKWTKKGFYLNGNRIKIRGLNRHQSYPYVGYAMPKSMQVMDARILK